MRLKITNLFIRLMLCFLTASVHANHWMPLAKGVQYLDMNDEGHSSMSHIHVFKFNLQDNQFQIKLAHDNPHPSPNITHFVNQSHSLAINGGFFDPNTQPLGLRISQFKRLNPLKKISWWGVFYIKNNKPYITTHARFNLNKKVSFAIQSGPRLIVNGSIPKLKNGIAERSAIGITRNGEVILLATQNMAITTHKLAKLMQSHHIDCVDAMNLDGGHSTQLFANYSPFTLHVSNFSKVSDAIVVTKKLNKGI